MLRNNLFFFVAFAVAIGLSPFVFPNVFGVEIGHSQTTVTTDVTSTGLTWINVTGAVIDSTEFTVGEDYLIMVSGENRFPWSVEKLYVSLVHGNTNFTDSLDQSEEFSNPDFYSYNYWTVWTAVAGEDVYLKWKADATALRHFDQIKLIAIHIEELTENTDWFYDSDSSTTALTTSWSTSNNPEITFTPSETSDWLVMTSSYHFVDNLNENLETRINSTGTINELQPFASQEGEQVDEQRVKTLYRVFTLDSESNTFTQESRNAGGSSGTREAGQVFALNLERFVDNESIWNETSIDICNTCTF